MAALSADFASRVQSFFVEYLGEPNGRPVPFGGRQTALANLDRWIGDPVAPQRVLITAPAGRGKSALLAHWSRRLLEEERELSVIFFPVSIRFRTNLASVVFPTIAAQLSALHGEDLTASQDAPVEIWRALVTNYLARSLPHERRLLVVLDGIDEAADWEPGSDLFPLSLPQANRIVLSARYLAGDMDAAGWLRRLGWDRPGQADSLALEPLTADGVADVLRRTAFPLDRLGARVDIVSELHRLSEGDPLLVRLYVEDLWARGEASIRLQPEDLRQIRPGIEGFFARWWDDQRLLWGNQAPLREPAAQALLNLFACALGPLRQTDCLELAPPEACLTPWTLEEVLRPFARFVIGDGLSRGYTFSHPRLAYYFYDRLQRSGQAHKEELRFVDWGHRTLTALDEGRLDPAEAPPYIVQYFGAHLERSGADVQGMLGLLGAGWRSAWESVDKTSYLGFLNDAKRVLRCAQEANRRALGAGEPLPYLDVEIRCVLYQASVGTPPKISMDLVKALIEKGLWGTDQGITYAAQIPDPDERLTTLVELDGVVPPNQRLRLRAPALGAIRAVLKAACATSGDNSLEPLRVLLPSLPESLHDTWLEAALETMPDQNPERQTRELLELARLCRPPSVPVVSAALGAARHIGARPIRAAALCTLAFELREGEQDAVFEEALMSAGAVVHEPSRATVLRELMFLLPDRFLGMGLSAILDLEDPRLRAAVLEEVACILRDSDLLRALAEATRSPDAKMRARLLRILLPLVPDELKQEAATLIWTDSRAATRADERTTMLAGVWRYLPEPQRSEARQVWVSAALRVAATIGNVEQYLRALTAIIRSVGAPVPDVLMEHLRRIAHPSVALLLELAPHLSANQTEAAIALTAELPSPDRRLRVLCAIALHAHEPTRSRILALALTEIPEVPTEALRYVAGPLLKIVPEEFDLFGEPDALFPILRSGDARVRTFARLLLSHPPEPSDVTSQDLADIAAGLRAPALWRRIVSLSPAPWVDALVPKLVAIAFEKRSERVRVPLVRSLLPHAAEMVLEDIVSRTLSLPDWAARCGLLTDLAPVLPEASLTAAWKSAAQASSLAERKCLLNAFVPHLPPPILDDVLAKTLHTMAAADRLDLLCFLLPQFPDSRRDRALRAIFSEADDGAISAEKRIALFPVLEPWFPPPRREDCEVEWLAPALVDALNSSLEQEIPSRVRRLAPHLRGHLLGEAVEAARDMQSERIRVEVLRLVIPRMASPRDDEAIDALLAYTRNKGSLQPKNRCFVLRAVGALLPEDRRLRLETLARLWELAASNLNEDAQTQALIELAPQVHEEHLVEVMPLVRNLVVPSLPLLEALAPRLPAEMLVEQLNLARNWQDPHLRMRLLCALAPHLEPGLRKQSVEDALSAYVETAAKGVRAQEISALASLLSVPQLERALAVSRYIGDHVNRARMLIQMAAELSEQTSRRQLLNNARMIAGEIAAVPERARVLCEIASLCSPDLREEVLADALTAAREIQSEMELMSVLKVLVPIVVESTERLLTETLDLLEQKEFHRWSEVTLQNRQRLILELIPHLPKYLLSRALDAVRRTWVAALLEGFLVPCRPLPDPGGLADSLTIFRSARGGRYRAPPSRPDDRLSLAPLVREALADAGGLGFITGPARFDVVTRLAPFLPKTERLDRLDRALSCAVSLPDGVTSMEALCGLIPHLFEELLIKALILAGQLNISDHRARYLGNLVTYLPDPLFDRAFRAAQALPEERLRVAVYKRLLPMMAKTGGPEVLAAIRSIDDPVERTRVLWRLGQTLRHEECLVLMAEALATARSIPAVESRVGALGDLAPVLPQQLLGELVSAALEIEDETQRVGAMWSLAPHLPETLRARLLAATSDLACPACRAAALEGLTPYLSEDMQREALTSVAALPHASFRATALRGCLAHLPDRLLPAALDVVDGIGKGFAYLESICAIAPRLGQRLALTALHKALAETRRIFNDEYRGEILSKLIPNLPEALLPEALDVARSISGQFVRADTLRAFVPRMLGLRDALLSAVRELTDQHNRAALLAELAVAGTAYPDEYLLKEGLDTCASIGCRLHRAEALREMALRPAATTPAVLRSALTAVLAVGRDDYSVTLLGELASRLPVDLFSAGLDAVSRIRADVLRAQALTRLAPYLPPTLRDKAVDVAGAIRSGLYRSQALVALAPHLDPQTASAAMSAAFGIRDQWHRAKAAAALVPLLPADLVADALQSAYGIESELVRLEAVSLLLPSLEPGLLDGVLAAADQFRHQAYAGALLERLSAVATGALAPRSWRRREPFRIAPPGTGR